MHLKNYLDLKYIIHLKFHYQAVHCRQSRWSQNPSIRHAACVPKFAIFVLIFGQLLSTANACHPLSRPFSLLSLLLNPFRHGPKSSDVTLRIILPFGHGSFITQRSGWIRFFNHPSSPLFLPRKKQN